MKKLGLLLIVLAVLLAAAAPVFAGGEQETEELTVGVVLPYEIGWFTAFHEGFEKVAVREGVKLNWQYHEYAADKETTAIQNLITVGVDAINVTSASPESAEYSARLANEAKIPIQITESGGIAEGGGKPFADIDFNWYSIYHDYVAPELRDAVDGDIKVLWLQGFLGSPPVMSGIEGFKDAIAGMKGIELATDVQDGQYSTEASLPLTQAMIQSGLDFNVAMGASQEITQGIIVAMEQEGIPLDEVTIVTVNGGPMDIQNLKDGKIDYCLSISPGLHGMICAQNLINYMKGRKYQEKSYSPAVWCTADNWEEKLIPWDVDESWFPVVDAFIETGKYRPELRK